ncbi:MAG: amidohydrolase family protein [Gammaproteobacteria bacterium]|nr:amidohydrolase family protein [Gammaproteobacteria bacterium]
MGKLILTNANLLDGEHPAQSGSTVVVDNDRIAAVGPDSSGQPGPHDQVIDLQGQTLMPGLVMGHYHACYREYGADGAMAMPQSAIEQAYLALSNAQIALDCGYTSVVSAGTHHNIDTQLAESIDAGDVIGPRVIPCSRNFMPVDEEIPGGLDGEEVCMAAGPDGFRQGALRDLERGAKILKIFASGGHGATLTRGMTADEIGVMVATAREHGARVRAHVAGRDKVLECVRLGVDIIDHADGVDQECIEAFIEHDSFVLPSIYLLLRVAELGGNSFGFETDLKAFNYMCQMLPTLVAAGVKLVPGDDFGVWQIPHGTYAEELVCYVERANVTPLDVIRWSTQFGGGLTAIPDLGTIAPGSIADLLIVDGDPSADISILTRPERLQAVIKGGVVVSGALTESTAAAA